MTVSLLMRAPRLAPLLACLCLLALAGCGKKGDPVPPGPPDKVIWPKTYPTH